MDLAVYITTRLLIIDTIAVAHGQALLRAVPPDRVLHEPGKDLWELPIELPRIDASGDRSYDVSATARLIALLTVGMAGVESVQDAGSVHEIVHQRVDGDHAATDLDPSLLF